MRVTLLGHDDPQPSHDPAPFAPPQDPYIDDPVPRYLANLTPPARRASRGGRRTGVIVGVMATLVVLVGGGSAIAALIDKPDNNGGLGPTAAGPKSGSPTTSTVQPPVT